MTDITNLTPHAVTIGDRTIPPSGNVARVSATYVADGDIGGLPAFRQSYGDVANLPDPAPGAVYIVSAIVLAALAGSRPDVVAPATGHPDVVRDDAGRIVSVPGVVR